MYLTDFKDHIFSAYPPYWWARHLCSRNGVVAIAFVQGNTDISNIIIIRMANREHIHINNLTSVTCNRSAAMGTGKGGTKINQHQ